jgi:hypothetical protein
MAIRRIELTNVQTIEIRGFHGQFYAKQLILPGTLAHLGEHAFSRNQFTEVYIANGPTVISYSCFAESRELVSLELPDTVQYCQQSFARDCNLLENIWLGNSLKEVSGSYAFGNSPMLLHAYFPDTLQRLHANVFDDSFLQSISLPENLIAIDSDVFNYHSFESTARMIPILHIRGPTVSQPLCEALDSLPDGSRIFASNLEGTTICADYNFTAELSATVYATHGLRPPRRTPIATRTLVRTPEPNAPPRRLNLNDTVTTVNDLDPSEPLHLTGSGTLRSDGEPIYLSVVVLEAGAQVTVTDLVVQDALELKGDSGLTASIGSHIELVSDVKLQFTAEDGKMPRGI